MSKRISRATLLRGMWTLGVSAFAGAIFFGDAFKPGPKYTSRMLGPSKDIGHRIRDGSIKLSSDVKVRTKVAIIGGGIAGLSAAWWLQKHGCTDFRLFELESDVGGNSRSGANKLSAYPWGAHYVPLANPESEYVRQLFEQIGVIQGYDKSGHAIYNELYLCHEPQERLLKDGTFQDGMIPHRGLQAGDKQQIERFLSIVHGLREKKGTDGKAAFAIPVDLSSQDAEFTALDRLSMAAWLRANGFDSKPLLWYINYCCRDDYGSTIENVSAWAGIHYFAGRRGTAANSEMNSVVTWPEGNGFLVSKLRELVKGNITSDTAVARVADSEGKLHSSCVSPTSAQSFAAESDYIIFAAPRFIARHIIAGAEKTVPEDLAYAPWMVANVTVRSVPHGKGTPLAWDNVSYTSDSLGYVVATHQNITTREAATVLTYYMPMSQTDPQNARRDLNWASEKKWSQRIVDDLAKMHPGIEDEITSIDLWPWGHGMVRPSVGFIWSDARRLMAEPLGNVYFAHSDMSGMSNFEEAQYHGVRAAESVLARLKA